MNKKNYVLGLDLGVASIGWACMLLDENDMPKRILDQNVTIFKAIDNDKGKIYNQERRTKRGMRRRTRRRKERLRMIKNHLVNQGIVTKDEIHEMYQGKGKHQGVNVFELKIKGLKEELTNIELAKVLIHYSKFRGFKSNRKIDKTSEEGKMKEAIGAVKLIMKRDDVLVTQAIQTLKNEKGLDTYHNQEENYNYGFERADVEQEIRVLLERQKSFHNLSEDWIETYIKLWGNQRDFSEGPAIGSPYHVDFEKFFGFCKFYPEEKRAPRGAPSYEIFVLLDKLNNLRYFTYDAEGNKVLDEKGRRIIKHNLNVEQIKSLYTLGVGKAKCVKYVDVLKAIGATIEEVGIVDLPELGSKEFNKLIVKYKEKHNISLSTKLSEEQYTEIKKLAYAERLKKPVYELKSYKDLESQLAKLSAIDLFTREQLDIVATILAYAQTDNAIENKVKEKYNNIFSDKQIDVMKNLQLKLTGSGNISLKLVYKLLPELLSGKAYTEAMATLNFDHSLLNSSKEIEFTKGFPTVREIEDKFNTVITNPNVKHILAMLRKVYNAIYEQYGEPKYVHVEVAREVRNSFSERNILRKEQTNNQIANQMAKVELSKLIDPSYLETKHYHNFSKDDLVKFRLWKEQNGRCMYSGQEIPKEQLLISADYEVDHILPFSRTFDDSFSNKVLVIKQTNQEKCNQTPYEWLHKRKDGSWDEFKERVESNTQISRKKKQNFLQVEDIEQSEMTAQSLHATSYASKLVAQIFKSLLKTEDNSSRVKTFKGGMTSYLRNYYKLNGLTHSLESKDYKRSDTIFTIDKIEIKSGKKDKCSIGASATDVYGNTIQYELKVNYKNDSGFSSQFDEDLYQLIVRDADRFIEFCELKRVKDKGLFDIEELDVFSEIGKKDEIFSHVLFELLNGLKSNINEKNRNNHFHHIVDAILVAIMTPSMQIKISNFHKIRQELLNGKTEYIDEFGEILTYESLKQRYTIDDSISKNPKYQIPLPYPKFVEELKFRVFERDSEILKEALDTLPQYEGVDTSTIQVKYPKLEVDRKVRGGLHAETILGIRNDVCGKIAVKKESVHNLDLKKLESLFDKDGGQKEVYETLKQWIKDGKKGFPKQKNGNLIKKVRLTKGVDNLVKISPSDEQKGYAQIGSVARIEIYKKEDDDKLYFVQIPIDAYLKRKKGNKDFNVLVWWGRDKNKVSINYQDLLNEYQHYITMYPGQPVKVKMKSNESMIASVVGFSSGMFEVSSITGDGIDLINAKVFKKVRSQYQLTISTIQCIENIKVSTLGVLQ